MGVRLPFCTLANGHAAALRAHGPVRARVAHEIGNGSAQRDMNFHQIVRTDLHVERFGEIEPLQPRCDAADACDIYLDDRATAALQILSEMGGMVDVGVACIC